MICPNCGAESSDSYGVSYFCTKCGARLASGTTLPYNNSELVPVNSFAPANTYTNTPNLIIQYNSAHPRVLLVVRIVSTGDKRVYYPGDTATYTLRPGPQAIILKIGKKNYRRDVVITPGTPVTIKASWSGGVSHIDVFKPTTASFIPPAY